MAKKYKAKVKAAKVWNIKALDEIPKEASKAKFSDDGAGVILSRSLEHISSELYLQRGKDENFMNIGIDVNNEGGYSDIITSLKVKVEGDFAEAGTSDNSKGTLTLSGEKSSLNVYQLEAGSNWSFVEMRQAEMGQTRSPSLLLMRGHNSKYLTKIDDIGFFGNNGNDGLINHADATVLTASQNWQNMTNVELTNELQSLIVNQRLGKNSELKCDVVVVSDEVMLKIQSSNADDGIDKTIKEKLEESYGVRFVESAKLSNTSTLGTASRAVALSTNSEALVFRIPVPLTISNIYQTGDWKYNFDSFFRIAGLDVLEKDVIYILDEF